MPAPMAVAAAQVAAQASSPQSGEGPFAEGDEAPPDPGGGGGSGGTVADVPAADCSQAANGFYQDLATGCRRYYFCIEGRKTSLVCPPDNVFDGQLCVDARTYSCPMRPPMKGRGNMD